MLHAADVTLVISADGSATLRIETVETRQYALDRLERDGFMDDGGGIFEEPAEADAEAKEDEARRRSESRRRETETRRAARWLIESETPYFRDERVEAKVESVEVTDETVRIVTVASFRDLATLTAYAATSCNGPISKACASRRTPTAG